MGVDLQYPIISLIHATDPYLIILSEYGMTYSVSAGGYRHEYVEVRGFPIPLTYELKEPVFDKMENIWVRLYDPVDLLRPPRRQPKKITRKAQARMHKDLETLAAGIIGREDSIFPFLTLMSIQALDSVHFQTGLYYGEGWLPVTITSNITPVHGSNLEELTNMSAILTWPNST